MNGLGLRSLNGTTSPASAAWGTASTALYLPLMIPWEYTVQRLFWYNGSAAGGNCDMGVFTPGGANIWSAGSTACSGNSARQYVAPAASFVLSPGLYYLGLSHDNATANGLQLVTVAAATGRLLGVLQQTSALPLPSPAATYATFTATVYPLIGMTNTASGF